MSVKNFLKKSWDIITCYLLIAIGCLAAWICSITCDFCALCGIWILLGVYAGAASGVLVIMRIVIQKLSWKRILFVLPIWLIVSIFILIEIFENGADLDGRQQENSNQKYITTDGKTSESSLPDPKDLPLYVWEYPSTRERLKNKVWFGEKLERHEKILHPHRFKATLPEGTKIASTSKYTRLRLDKNGIVYFTFNPLLDAMYYEEALEKLMDWIDRLDIQLSEISRKTLKDKRETARRKPRLKPVGISNKTIISGKIDGEKQVKVEFIFNAVSDQRKGWFFQVGIFPEEELRDEIVGEKDPKYNIRVKNVTKGDADYEYFLDNYDARAVIKDEKGSKIYSNEAYISKKGGFAHVPQGVSEIEMKEVPDGGLLYIQIKPKSNVSKEDLKYLPFEKTIPGKKLEVGQTIQIRLKKNPDHKGN